MRENVVHGRKSINCANSVLPVFMITFGISTPKISPTMLPPFKSTPPLMTEKSPSHLHFSRIGLK